MGSRSRTRAYWACQLGGWTAAALVNLGFVQPEEPDRPRWKFALAFGATATLALVWTHGYRHVIRRRGWVGLGLGRLAPRVLASCAVLGAAITFTAAPLWLLLFETTADPVAAWAPQAVLGWAWTTFGWSVVYFGVHYFERWRQAELDKLQLVIAAKDAQLEGLMAQLQPHFLFNCLNSVRALIAEDPAKAQATVTQLSSLLRYSLQARAASTVPLATELEIVRTYLALEAVRFEDRLATELAIGDDTTALPVPAMLVQALVENAVKHGVERTPAGGTIRIRTWRDAGSLRIRVDSPGQIRAAATSTRIGLANARERLRLLYGPGASLALREADGGVVAEVEIPTEAA